MTDVDQCPCSGINLDKFLQPMILLCLAEQGLHGYGLIQQMTNSLIFKGERPDPTGVYRTLKSMEDRHLVVSSWDFVESGPPKKVYQITSDGMACLERWIITLRDYRNSIEALVITGDRILRGSDRANLAGDHKAGPVLETKTVKQTR